MNFRFGIIVAWLALAVSAANAANILGMFLTHSPSHVIVHMSVVRALVDRGHNVTVITSMPLKEKSAGFRHIFLESLEITQADIDSMVGKVKDASFYERAFNSVLLVRSLVEKYSRYVDDSDFQSFLKEGNQFDLVLLGYMFNEFQLGLASHFKCPTALSWMIQPVGHVSRLIGNPNLPAFVPSAPFMDPGPMDFCGRVQNFVISTMERVLSFVFGFYLKQLYIHNYPPEKYPSLAEMKKNVSLILFNHHFSEGPVRPLVPGLVEIGGIQIKDKPDPLPEEIEVFLEESPEGAILFSLGSYMREDHLPPETVEIIYKVFSSLPYRVLWKSNQATHLGNASNILFLKWFPQDDILAHRHLKLFVTHGGKGSITEAEYHGVPMVAIPLIGDQHGNANTIGKKGHGLVLNHWHITEQSFRDAIVDVIESPRYRNAVQTFSRLYRDRPLTARENAVYWIEYVIRHRGAPHMQSPLKNLNILQEYSIDVIIFLVVLLYAGLRLLKLLLKFLKSILTGLWRGRVGKNKRE